MKINVLIQGLLSGKLVENLFVSSQNKPLMHMKSKIQEYLNLKFKMSKKLTLRFIAFAGLTMLLTACPYTTELPIDEPSVKVDDKILGKWEAKSSDYTYTVTKKDEFNYKFEKKGKNSTDVSNYTGFLSVIDGVRFMNIYEDASSTKTYYLYKIEQSTSGAKITLLPVTENIYEKFATSAELKAYIKKYMALSFFYEKDQEEYFRAD